MKRWVNLPAGLACVAAACLVTAAAPVQAQDAPALPARLAILPFQCNPPCTELPGLQQELSSRLIDGEVFGLLLTRDMEEMYFGVRKYRTLFDTLSARAQRGVAPDSVQGAALARRFNVDGFLYAYRGKHGPVVEVWTPGPRAAVTYRYEAPEQVRGQLPDASFQGDTKRAMPMTGGAQTASGPSAARGGTSTTTTEATPEMPKSADPTKEPILVNTNLNVDDRTREMAETVAKEIAKIRGVKLNKD